MDISGDFSQADALIFSVQSVTSW